MFVTRPTRWSCSDGACRKGRGTPTAPPLVEFDGWQDRDGYGHQEEPLAAVHWRHVEEHAGRWPVHGQQVHSQRRERACEQERTPPQRECQGRTALGAAVRQVHILEEHHDQKRGVAGRGERGGGCGVMIRGGGRHVAQREAKDEERCHAHHQCRDHDPLEHHRVEDRLNGRPRRSVEFVSLAWLECQGHILDAVGDEIEPEELHRRERQR